MNALVERMMTIFNFLKKRKVAAAFDLAEFRRKSLACYDEATKQAMKLAADAADAVYGDLDSLKNQQLIFRIKIDGKKHISFYVISRVG